MDIAFTGDNGWSTNGFRLKINEKEAGVGPFKKKKKKKPMASGVTVITLIC